VKASSGQLQPFWMPLWSMNLLTKSAAGLLLPTKIFDEINPELTKRWEQIKKELKMNNDQHTDSHV